MWRLPPQWILKSESGASGERKAQNYSLNFIAVSLSWCNFVPIFTKEHTDHGPCCSRQIAPYTPYVMNISYNWLKEYVDFTLTPDEVAEALTSVGLEVGSVEEVQSIRGGLKGIVTAEVLTCEMHPNSDHLHVCSVNLGEGEVVQIVCGAPNVAAGQKVVVATVGTTLYDGDKEFVIKKSKLRGVESHGMICAEDEIGVGTSHDGIIVLPAETPVGMPAATYYNLQSDYVIEVDKIGRAHV